MILKGDVLGVTVGQLSAMYGDWLPTQTWSAGVGDPVQALDRVFGPDFYTRDPDEILEDAMVWLFIRHLRLVERYEIVHLDYFCTANVHEGG